MRTDLEFDGLRVLGFCDYFAEDSSGGAEKVAREVYSRMMAAGAQVMVVSAVSGRSGGITTVSGVPTRLVPGRDLSPVLRAQVTVAPGLLAATGKAVADFRPNVLHASSVHFQGSLAAALHVRRRRSALVTTAHVGSILELPSLTRVATTVYEHTVGRFILRSSRRVIAVSEAVADHVRSLGARRGSVSVVPNGVDHEHFRPGTRDAERVHLVFVGRLIQNKGPNEALEAFAAARTDEARLAFIGDGPMRGELESTVAELGLKDRVRFVGHVEDVAPLLASADVLVRPSLTEGQSLAILEAMAAGVSVLASDIPANREIIDSGESGLLVRPGDKAQLANSMRTLIDDQALRVRLASVAKKRALQHSWDRCARETGRVLAGVAEGWESR